MSYRLFDTVRGEVRISDVDVDNPVNGKYLFKACH